MKIKVSKLFLFLSALALVSGGLIYLTSLMVFGLLRPLSAISVAGLFLISALSSLASLAVHCYEVRISEATEWEQKLIDSGIQVGTASKCFHAEKP